MAFCFFKPSFLEKCLSLFCGISIKTLSENSSSAISAMSAAL
jgi:hypothetical protein